MVGLKVLASFELALSEHPVIEIVLGEVVPLSEQLLALSAVEAQNKGLGILAPLQNGRRCGFGRGKS